MSRYKNGDKVLSGRKGGYPATVVGRGKNNTLRLLVHFVPREPPREGLVSTKDVMLISESDFRKHIIKLNKQR